MNHAVLLGKRKVSGVGPQLINLLAPTPLAEARKLLLVEFNLIALLWGGIP